MRISLDSNKCQGHGRCYALAPQLFEPDDEGFAVLCGNGDVGAALEDEALLAADNCPEYAIEVSAD